MKKKIKQGEFHLQEATPNNLDGAKIKNQKHRVSNKWIWNLGKRWISKDGEFKTYANTARKRSLRN